jgi:hypothetical protein
MTMKKQLEDIWKSKECFSCHGKRVKVLKNGIAAGELTCRKGLFKPVKAKFWEKGRYVVRVVPKDSIYHRSFFGGGKLK